VLIAAMDVGGTHVATALVRTDPLAVVSGSGARTPLDAAAAAAVLLSRLSAAASASQLADADRWGIAMPGPFDYEHGIGRYSGVAKFESLYGVDVRTSIAEAVGAPMSDVVFVNDADAFALGEWAAGAATGADRCVGITLGTGVGSGWIAGGRAIGQGPGVPPGGEAHLLEIDGRPLEDVVSRRAIRHAYQSLATRALGRADPDGSDPVDLDVREIAARARVGDASAAAVFTDVFEALGRALGPHLSVFGAQVLVVGGSIAGAWDLIEPPLRRGLGPVADSMAVAVSDDAERAALLGAAHSAHRVSSKRLAQS
jgi:glucokinase